MRCCGLNFISITRDTSAKPERFNVNKHEVHLVLSKSTRPIPTTCDTNSDAPLTPLLWITKSPISAPLKSEVKMFLGRITSANVKQVHFTFKRAIYIGATFFFLSLVFQHPAFFKHRDPDWGVNVISHFVTRFYRAINSPVDKCDALSRKNLRFRANECLREKRTCGFSSELVFKVAAIFRVKLTLQITFSFAYWRLSIFTATSISWIYSAATTSFQNCWRQFHLVLFPIRTRKRKRWNSEPVSRLLRLKIKTEYYEKEIISLLTCKVPSILSTLINNHLRQTFSRKLPIY